MDKEWIQHKLMKELSDAEAAYDAARGHFRAIANAIPAGPAQDGSLGILQAGEESRRALENYGRAVRRCSDFKLRGMIPEDLQNLKESD